MAEPKHAATREINAEELLQMNAHLGLPPARYGAAVSKQGGVIKGRWSLYGEGRGLSMHCGDFEELSDVSSSLELPAGLSLTLIMGGQVSFALGARQHTIGQQIRPVECACFALAKPDVLTRYMQKGQKVCKLNVFVERTWLERRFSSAAESTQLEQIFRQHAALSRWQPSAEAVALCQGLLAMGSAQSIGQQLKLESRILELVGELIEAWVQLLRQAPVVVPAQAVASLADTVKLHIDRHEDGEISLQGLAEIHHVSISTLQRRFKASYGTTVIGYMRQRQLERARVALVCNGQSIGEAAYLAGYSHVENFIAAFTKAYAMSPSQYRALHQTRKEH